MPSGALECLLRDLLALGRALGMALEGFWGGLGRILEGFGEGLASQNDSFYDSWQLMTIDGD